MEAFSLQGKVAVITGGGSGLGYGIAGCMRSPGARVVLLGRRRDNLRHAAETLGDDAHFEAYDVTRLEESEGVIRRIEESVGPVDILVNNAGVHLKKPALETTEAEMQQVLDTHVMGAYALTRAAAPGMLARGGGAILFIASMASFMGIPYVIAYTAAKSAYLGLVRGLAAEFSPGGVRVNAIAPGWIESPMMRKALESDETRKNKILGRTPMGRFGEASDIGHAAVYLCSPAARFITGAVLPVDGGASIGF